MVSYYRPELGLPEMGLVGRQLWQQSGRWYDIKDEMFRLKDRHGRDMGSDRLVGTIAALEPLVVDILPPLHPVHR